MIVKSSRRYVASSSIYCARSLAPVGAVSPSPLRPPRFCPLLIHSNSCCDIQTREYTSHNKTLHKPQLCQSEYSGDYDGSNISLITARAMMLLLFTMCQAQAQHWLWLHGSRFQIRTLHFAFWPLPFINCQMLLRPFPPPKNVHLSLTSYDFLIMIC